MYRAVFSIVKILVSAAFSVMVYRSNTDMQNAVDIIYYGYSNNRSDCWCNTSWHKWKLFDDKFPKWFSQNDETCSITFCKFTKIERVTQIVGAK